MTKDILKEKIRKLLDVTASESEVAFELMIKKISGLIKPDEALKIPDLGVFMLKKEPLPREERLNVGATSKNSLIFSPVSDDFSSDSDSAFLSFDLDEMEKDNFEFSDNIFSVSVGKPIVTPTGVKNFDSSENDGAMKTTLEDKVTQLVTNSERTADFNLWDNYLSSVGKSEDVEDDLKELISQNVGERPTEKEAEAPQPEDEISEEKEIEEDSVQEPVEEKPETGGTEEEIKWDWGEELKEELGAEAESEETPLEESEPEEEVNKEIDDETSELFEPVDDEEEKNEPEAEEIPEETDEPESENDGEPAKEDAEVEDEAGDDFDNARETVEYSPGDLPREPKVKKKGFAIPKLGKLFWILLGAFLIIGITGAYFLFFTGGEKPAEQKAATEQKEEVPPEEYRKRLKPEEDRIAFNESNNQTAEETNAAAEEQTDETIHPDMTEAEKKPEEANKEEAKPAETKHETAPPKHEQKVEEKPKQKEETTVQQNNSLYRKFPGEKQISNLIFKHGGTYSVQISSWRDKNKAESETKRLKNIGYNAFIVEKYLSALRSKWYLVRVGFFNSPEEAKQFRTKNKF
ncbi:MAG: hypothetical protein GXO87_01855 [Chlorobi bacterium]|nr:hypothetical protein [Chlorobiota bacterium]